MREITRPAAPQAMPAYMVQDKPKSNRLYSWWFRISSPPEPAPDAPLVQREKYRRARTSSIINFLLQLYVITSLPAGFFGTNSLLAVLLIGAFLANVAAMFLNRSGWVTVAGLVLVLNVEASTTTNILTTPGGLGLSTLPLFDLLVIPLALAASILPEIYIVAFAVLNSIFIVLCLLLLPQHADLAQAFKVSGIGLVSLPIIIQLVLAFLSFLWVRSANRAIVRADRAEQIALLEHDIAESRQVLAEQKTQLEGSIQEISHALLSSNNGKSSIRISTQGNPLWLIVGPINNLMARLERLRQVDDEYQRLTRELEQLLSAIRIARNNRQRIRPPSGQGSARLGVLYEEIAHIQIKDEGTTKAIVERGRP